MGLLFQPRWTTGRPGRAPTAGGAELPDRGAVFSLALDAVLRGDASRFADVFSDDVVVASPQYVVAGLASVQRALGSPEESLADIELLVTGLDAFDERVIGEWCLEARFTRPIVWDDSLLLEPTGGEVRMLGASFAEFRGNRIRAFRHYFDDSALLAGVPGAPSHLRWRTGS